MPVKIRDDIYSGIAEQFPDIYKEDGGLLVEFVKAYYKHLDEKMDRDVPKLRDIDTTLTKFLIYYKKKYLADLPLDTTLDTRFILKHIQDMYRRKGTQESLELLFRLFFDEEIEVFYPSTAILRPSDSVWGGDAYLEMLPVYTVDDYPIQKGMRIRGDLSLASAFVDEVLFVNFSGSLSPVIYLSNVAGTFSADDAILIVTVDANGNESTQNIGKLISGSISNVSLLSTNRLPNQKVGDKVQLKSVLTGIDGEGRVTKTSQTETGSIEFSIEDGGFGYVDPTSITASNNVGISNQVMIVDQSTPTDFFKPGDIIYATTAMTYDGSTTAGATQYTVNGSAKVIHFKHPLLFIESNSQAEIETFMDTQYVNSAGATRNVLSDVLINLVTPGTHILPAQYNDYSDPFTLDSTLISGTKAGMFNNVGSVSTTFNGNDVLKFGEYLNSVTIHNTTELPTIAPISLVIPQVNNNVWSIAIQRVYQVLSGFDLFPGLTVGTDPASTGLTGQSNEPQLGVSLSGFPSVNNPRFNVIRERPGSTIYPDVSANTATVTSFGVYNDSAKFVVGSLTNTETVSLITDQIGDFGSLVLDADSVPANDDYGMSGPGAENLDTSIADAFSPITVKIGTIDSLNVQSIGSNYQNDVRSFLVHDNISKFNKKDIILTFSDVDFFLNAGDVITQARTIPDVAINQTNNITEAELEGLGSVTTQGGYQSSSTVFEYTSGGTLPYTAKAKFLKRVGNDFYFRPLSFYGFDTSLNILIGNVSKPISGVSEDPDSLPMGANASVLGVASYQTGQIDEVSIIKTGYRYTDNEEIEIINLETGSSYYNQKVATGTVRTLGQGKTEGRWRTKTSFLSESSKKIHDNDYYQEYSYDVSSIIDPQKYEPLIEETVGVAGTKLFSTPLINSNNTLDSSLEVAFTYYNIGTANFVTTDGDNYVTEQNTSDNLGAQLSEQIGTGP